MKSKLNEILTKLQNGDTYVDIPKEALNIPVWLAMTIPDNPIAPGTIQDTNIILLYSN